MNGIVQVNNQPVAPWIGVGESGSWSDVKEALNDCGLDFHVKAYESKFQYEENGMSYFGNLPNVYATVREDTHEALGAVSKTYTIVQNQDLFSMLQPFVNKGGIITNGGMTAEGLCFMIVDMGNKNVAGDDFTMSIMATNSFNGRYPAAIMFSPVRIICQNMYRSLMGHTDNVARFRHSLTINGRLETLKAAYEAFGDYSEEFSDKLDLLKKVQAKHSIEDVVEKMFPYTATNPDSTRYLSSIERTDQKRAFYTNRYYYADTNSDHGSCFALVNSYYDYMSHNVPDRKTEESYRSARLSGIVGGTSVDAELLQYMCASK